MTFRQIHTGKDYYEYSFFPLAIVQDYAYFSSLFTRVVCW